MACAFETTGAICMEVTDRIARNTAELSDIVAKERNQRLSCVLQKWNAHSIVMKLDAVV